MPTFAPTPLTYASYVQNVATLAVIPLTTDAGGYITTASPEFNLLIPQMLNYAELRIQRDLDLMALQYTSDAGYALSIGVSFFTVELQNFFTVQNIRLIVGSQKLPLIPTSKEFLQICYPDDSYVAQPQYFAPTGSDPLGVLGSPDVLTFQISPCPDQAYELSITGTLRAPSLAQYAGTPQATTSTTFISAWLPDLLLMASMIFVSGYQRNFSANSDDPQMAVNYEKQYQTLLKGPMVEEARKRFAASGWTSLSPAPVATADRK